jgi:NAD(P)-dependent dehydrogenase (short-subunit alcohol dehydrogenase family)
MRVIAVDMNKDALEKVTGVEHLVADLSKNEDRDKVVAAGQGAHALVNAAGLIRLKPILEFTVQDIRDIYAVNVEGVWDLTSRIGRTMTKGASIVNLSSVSAKLATTQETAVYASSKTAVLSITRSFAYAFGPKGVRVNAICPGIVDTPMQDKVLERLAEIRGITVADITSKRLTTVPLGRASEPRETAGFIFFLISDEGSYFTGQALSQDGGIVM